MTPAERIGQLNQLMYSKPGTPVVKDDPVFYEDQDRRDEVGSFLFLTNPKAINRLQDIAMTERRLRIPLHFGFDVAHGFDSEFPVRFTPAAS